MDGEKKHSKIRELVTLIVLVAMVLSTVSILTGSPVHAEMITAGGVDFGPNSLQSELNTTISHLSYTTQPPQFLVNNNYAQNATYTKGTGVMAINATYQIFQYNGSASSTVSALSYNYSHYVSSSAAYFFSDSKIGLNGTLTSPGLEIAYGNLSYATNVPITMSSTNTKAQNASDAQTFFIEINSTKSGSSDTYNATFAYWYDNAGVYTLNYSKMVGSPLQALNMYEVQVNIQDGTQQASIVYTNNGTVVQNTPILTFTNATKQPFLNFGHITHTSYVVNPVASTSGGFLFDWMYVVDQNTINYASSISTAYAPAISGDSSFVSSTLPFDPTSIADQSHFQSANYSSVANGAKVSNDLFTSVVNQSAPSMQNATGMNKTSVTTNFNGQMNGVSFVKTNAFTPVSNTTVQTNEQAQTWTTGYILTALENYLKAYGSTQAEKQMGTYVSPSDITLISYKVSSVFLNTNYSPSAANAIRDYLDNTYASILASNNLSVVNPTTNAIVAGAYAGDFYAGDLLPVVPYVHGNYIVNPLNNKVYTLASAGFAPGAYISGGAVIVPQFKLVGWDLGTPIFAETSGFGFGSIWSSLTSAGQAISNLATSAASTITNGIGTVANVVDNNVIKPASTAVSVTTSTVQKAVGQLTSSAEGVAGVISKNVQGAISQASAITSGSINSISGTLHSVASDTSSALMAGYNGVKTGLYSIGGSVSAGVSDVGNGLNSVGHTILNTAGKVASVATGALSSVYTSAKNFIAGTASNLYSAIKGVGNSAISTIDSIGNTITQGAKGVFSEVTNGIGSIGQSITGAISGISSDFTNAFSFLGGLPSLVSHILIYVGIGILVFVGIVIVFMVLRRRGSTHSPGEISI